MHHAPASAVATALPCACTALRKAARAVSRVYDAALVEAGMTTAQFAILRTLARRGAMPLSRLADVLVMERTSLYRTLGPLTRAGWVRIDAGPRGRARIVSVTLAGETATTAAAPAWEAAQARIVGTIGEDEWTRLAAALGGIVEISAAAG